MTTNSWPPGGRRGIADTARALTAGLLFPICAALVARGSSSTNPAPTASPQSAGAATPTAAATATPTAAPTARVAGNTANLTFTGTLSGSTTQAKAAKNAKPSTCGGGSINVGITLNGHDHDLLVVNVSYKGPARYTLGDVSTGTAALLSDALYGGMSEYTSTSGTVTYDGDKSITIDANLVGSATQTAHISGSAACA